MNANERTSEKKTKKTPDTSKKVFFAAASIQTESGDHYLNLIKYDGTSKNFLEILRNNVSDTPEYWSIIKIDAQTQRVTDNLTRAIHKLIDLSHIEVD